jgi:lysophospholipase L1-like esterase
MLQVKLILIVVVLVLGWGMALKARRPARGGGVGRAVGRPAFAEVTRGKQEAKYLALGDSYTIGESVDPAERYPVQVRRLLAQNDHLACGDPEIIAVTGWTTGNLLQALSAANAEPGNISAKSGAVGATAKSRAVGATANSPAVYDMVSLLIGVNNQFQGRGHAEYREQFGQLLQTCIRLAGNRPDHVVVLSIPDYSVTPFGRAGDTALIAAQIDSFNRINFGLAKDYKVNYVDVTVESRKAAVDTSLIAADGLHFSGKEYEVWARLMEPVFKGMLQ